MDKEGKDRDKIYSLSYDLATRAEREKLGLLTPKELRNIRYLFDLEAQTVMEACGVASLSTMYHWEREEYWPTLPNHVAWQETMLRLCPESDSYLQELAEKIRNMKER